MANDSTNQAGGVELPAGAKIGKYEVVERRAIGEQAIVYKCYDPLLDRHVAVKQISIHLAEPPKFLERFRREAQIIARLDAEQSAIIVIHELIEDQRGLFIVMEYVAGHTLETTLEENRGPIDPKAVLPILWRLAAGLHAVHAAGIVHRDIKPGNIIISEGLRPKITDFGVAAGATGQASMPLGATKYMAPELFGGGAADGRADMYSLGFVAYEMLLGRDRFNEIFADVVRDKHSEAIRWTKWHGDSGVEAPRLDEVGDNVPKELSDIVARMMQKDPPERFEDMESLGRTIRARFSPRARAAGLRDDVTLADVEAQVGMAAEALAKADAGDGLIVREDEDSSPTTALPKRRLSTRTRWVLVGVIVVSAIAVGIVAGLRTSRDRKALEDRVSAVFELAEENYLAGVEALDAVALKEAEEAFADVRARFPGSAAAARASVMEHLARAHRFVLADNWPGAAAEQEQARKNVNDVQAARDDLEKWTSDRAEEIQDFTAHRTNARAFGEAMKLAREILAVGDHDAAAGTLSDKTRELVLTSLQSRQLAVFRAEIAEGKVVANFTLLVDRAEQLIGQGKLNAARSAYASARVLLDRDRILKSDRREALRGQLAAKVDQLDAEAEYLAALDTASQADESGDKDALLAALRELDRIRPTDELKDRIKTTQAEILLAQGRRHVATGDLPAARRAFAQSLATRETHAARAAMLQLEQAVKRQTLMAAAQVAHDVGKYAEALDSFAQAAEIRIDAELGAKMRDCRYRLQMAEVQRLFLADKQYDRAIAASEKLRQIDPDKAAEIDSLQTQIAQARKYASILALGDEAMQRQLWNKARKHYNEAKKMLDSPEVQDRFKQLRYRQNVVYGSNAVAQEDYRGALGYFKIAKQAMNTPEINALIEQAEEKLKSSDE